MTGPIGLQGLEFRAVRGVGRPWPTAPLKAFDLWGGWGFVFEALGRGPGHRGLEDETPATLT